MQSEPSNDKGLKQLKMLTFLSIGSFIFFSYVAFLGFTGEMSLSNGKILADRPVNQGSVQGVTSNTFSSDPAIIESGVTAKLMVNNGGATRSEAVLELRLDKAADLAGVELFLTKDDLLKILEIKCTEMLTCISSSVRDDRVEIVGIVNPEDSAVLAAGTYEIATISYMPGSFGELLIDPLSTVLEVGSDKSILNYSDPYLQVGRY